MFDLANSISALALLASALAALYARWSAREARKANDIGRLNALLGLRIHYLALIQHQEKLAELLNHSPSGLQAVQKSYAELDTKLREVNQEIERQHSSVTGKILKS